MSISPTIVKPLRFIVYFICIFSSLIAVSQTVNNVSSTAADGSYKVGDALQITVTFSENVTVTGTPQLTLEAGISCIPSAKSELIRVKL